MLWPNTDRASCHSQLNCRPLSVTISLALFVSDTHSFPQICLYGCHLHFLSAHLSLSSVLLSLSYLPQLFLAITSSVKTDLCNTSGVVLEMLSRPGEEGFPDLVTVMRNLSTDSGMPTLPPGGGLASK